MPEKPRFRWKTLFIGAAAVAFVIIVFLVQALAGLNSRPVKYADPPAFVEDYVVESGQSEPVATPSETVSKNTSASDAVATDITSDFSNEQALVRKVVLDGESPDLLLRLLTHPEKAQRVKAALGLAAFNMEMAFDGPVDYWKKESLF